MIHLDSISLAFGDAVIFNDISCNFNEHQHIGVVGRNGAGKSTLLKAIAGQAMLDNGSVSIDRNKTIAYMPQDLVFTSTLSVVDEAFATFTELCQLIKDKELLEARLNHNPDAHEIDQYAHVTERLTHYDISACKARTERILRGLGFNDESLKKSVEKLSVGWRMRVLLAKLLLMNADFYLFDEPTNHLDIVSKEWFFEFLKAAPFGFLLVTHDRYFLDHGVNKIFELERGNGRLYDGTFSKYVELKEQERIVKEAAYNRQQKEINRKQATIDRFRASASKASFVQSMIKQLDKMELVELDPVLPKVNFKFPQPVRAGDVVLSFEKLSQFFDGKPIFTNISGEVRRGEKVAVIAPNGAGKTTLFNIIVGHLSSPEDSVVFGHNVTYAYFEQDQTRVLHPKNTVLQEVLQYAPHVSEATVRTMLGSFLFSGDDVEKTISVLSGGERCRVALVKLLLQNANFLLLDEPTNHLDLYAKEVLLQALQAYEGTVMLVCHDHDFLQRIATRILELTPTALNSYKGSYESYLADKKALTAQQEPQEGRKAEPKSEKTMTSQKERYLMRKELTSIEGKIERLELKTTELTNSLGEIEYGSKKYQEIVDQIKKNKATLADLSKQWEALMQRLDA